jgi:multidrug resistance efflux pump
VIAILENSDLAAQVQTAKISIETLRQQKETAKARLAEAQADKLRIVNGARMEERREARAGFEQTAPLVAQAERELERRSKLYAAGDMSREDFERARRDFEIAQKRGLESSERYNVVNAAARNDDLAKADATIQLANSQIREIVAQIAEAQARVLEAEARLSKTIVRAPMAGLVLRKRLHAGESFSPENSTDGIITIGDVSTLRVRADVDETDVAKIHVGQLAFITAEAYGAHKFRGRVVRINQILGRKNFRTERPNEKVDTKILEVLIELEPNQKLPLGLRVNAFIGEE